MKLKMSTKIAQKIALSSHDNKSLQMFDEITK